MLHCMNFLFKVVNEALKKYWRLYDVVEITALTLKKICSKTTDECVDDATELQTRTDEYRRITDESQTSADECRRITDEFIDEYRRVQTDIKFISRKFLTKL